MPEDPLQDRVELPEFPNVTVVGDSVHVSPADGEMLLARVTVPVNPRVDDTMAVDVPLAPELTTTLDVLTSSAKSCTVTANEVECASEPLVPVAVTAYVPAEPEHDRVAVPLGVEMLRTTLRGENAHVRPVVGDIVAASETVPLKP